MTGKQTLRAVRRVSRDQAELQPRRAEAMIALTEHLHDQPRELAAFALVHGLDGRHHSLGEIASMLKVSKTRVVQLIERAEARLDPSKS